MLDGIGRAPRERLAAGEVVGEHRILRMRLDERASAVRGLLVFSLRVQRIERRPELPAARFVRLSRDSSESEDGRTRFLGERGALHARPDEHERARRRVLLLAVELEPCPAGLDEIELLILARL